MAGQDVAVKVPDVGSFVRAELSLASLPGFIFTSFRMLCRCATGDDNYGVEQLQPLGVLVLVVLTDT